MFTIDASSGYLKNTATNRYVGVYVTNPDWRCYNNTTGNTAGQTLGFYVLATSEMFYTTNIIVEACEHDYQSEVTKDASCTEAGEMTYTCSKCGDSYTREINITDHDYVETIVAPTCNSLGLSTKVCSGCGDTRKETLAVKKHVYVDGVCECGKKQPLAEFTFGENSATPDASEGTNTSDGKELGANKTYTVVGADGNEYVLTLTDIAKVYEGAYDALGNSCLKLGTSSIDASFTFVVPEGAGKVVISVARYKDKDTTISVNGKEYVIESASSEGQYNEIVVYAEAGDTVTVETVKSRAKINGIDFYAASPDDPKPEEPITSAIIKGASITAGADLALNYIVAIPADHNLADYKMIIKMNGKEYTVYGDVDVNGVIVFSFKNIGPQYICESIDAELYYGEEFVTEKRDYSIKQYAIDFLDAFGNNPEYASLKAILGDILAYGEAAYEFVTGEDAGDKFKVGDELEASDAVPVDRAGASLSKTEGDVKFTAAGVEYYVSNKIYVKFVAAEGVVLYVNGEAVKADSYADGMYIFYTDEILACDFNKVFTFELKIGDEVIQTLTYSINSYAYAMYKADGSVRSNLALALYRYGVSSYKFYNPEN